MSGRVDLRSLLPSSEHNENGVAGVGLTHKVLRKLQEPEKKHTIYISPSLSLVVLVED
jgi:hypothetical protein